MFGTHNLLLQHILHNSLININYGSFFTRYSNSFFNDYVLSFDINLDSDNHYNPRQHESSARFQRRYDEDDTYDQTSMPNRQNYDRNSQSNRYTSTRRQPDNDQPTGGQRFPDNRQDDQQERVDGSYRALPRLVTNINQETIRRSQPSDQTPHTPQVSYTVNQNPSGNNPRSIVLDINISINVAGNRNPQITATANTIPSRSSPARSTAVIEDLGYVDLDIRSPERTARLATDGYIRSSPSKQSTTLLNDNDK